MPKPTGKESIIIAMQKRWRKSDIQSLKNNNLDAIAFAMLFSYCKFNEEVVVKTIISILGRSRASAKRSVNGFMQKCEKMGIDISKIDHEVEEKKKRPKKAKRGEVGKAISKLAPVLDLFNINKKNTLDIIKSIEEGEDFSQEAILASYKVLYTLLMAKARGETVTKKTSASYEIIEEDDGTVRKVLAKNSEGGKKVWEETQSHLPDERAFAGALVVMEVIQSIEGGNSEYLTQEEKEERYEAYLKQVAQERIAYGGKEYIDAELEEV